MPLTGHVPIGNRDVTWPVDCRSCRVRAWRPADGGSIPHRMEPPAATRTVPSAHVVADGEGTLTVLTETLDGVCNGKRMAELWTSATALQEAQSQLPQGWKQYWSSPQQRPYYMHKKSRVCVWERPDERSGSPNPTSCICRKCYMARIQASGAAEPVSPRYSAGESTQGSPAHDAVADKAGSNGRRGSGLERIWEADSEQHRALRVCGQLVSPPAATGSRETRPPGLAHEPGEAANVYERQAASEHSACRSPLPPRPEDRAERQRPVPAPDSACGTPDAAPTSACATPAAAVPDGPDGVMPLSSSNVALLASMTPQSLAQGGERGSGSPCDPRAGPQRGEGSDHFARLAATSVAHGRSPGSGLSAPPADGPMHGGCNESLEISASCAPTKFAHVNGGTASAEAAAHHERRALRDEELLEFEIEAPADCVLAAQARCQAHLFGAMLPHVTTHAGEVVNEKRRQAADEQNTRRRPVNRQEDAEITKNELGARHLDDVSTQGQYPYHSPSTCRQEEGLERVEVVGEDRGIEKRCRPARKQEDTGIDDTGIDDGHHGWPWLRKRQESMSTPSHAVSGQQHPRGHLSGGSDQTHSSTHNHVQTAPVLCEWGKPLHTDNLLERLRAKWQHLTSSPERFPPLGQSTRKNVYIKIERQREREMYMSTRPQQFQTQEIRPDSPRNQHANEEGWEHENEEGMEHENEEGREHESEEGREHENEEGREQAVEISSIRKPELAVGLGDSEGVSERLFIDDDHGARTSHLPEATRSPKPIIQQVTSVVSESHAEMVAILWKESKLNRIRWRDGEMRKDCRALTCQLSS